MSQLITVTLCLLFVLPHSTGITTKARSDSVQVASVSLLVSDPIVTDTDNNLFSVSFPEATSHLTEPGKTLLPVFTQSFTFPFGTTIQDITIDIQTKHYTLPGKLITNPLPEILDSPYPTLMNHLGCDTNETMSEFYPDWSYRIQTGAGIQGVDHVLFVTIIIAPRYNPHRDLLESPMSIDTRIQYTPPSKSRFTTDSYDLLIITPSVFLSQLTPLSTHKNSMGMRTLIQTTESIYASYEGTDRPEQIKQFIKDAIETYGISSLLLVGDINQVPMRTVHWKMDDGTTLDMLVDLYYSDVYNASGGYCNWDANNNHVYGEEDDGVDFYPDVHLGRLACTTQADVQTVVEKIIAYESDQTSRDWFHELIVMAGDTFPEDRYPGATGREGEEQTIDIMNIMSQFNHTAIWTSKHNFNKKTIDSEISDGAGFVFYSGHGFPNVICPEGGSRDPRIHYHNRYLNGLKNGVKLPIVFIEACSTAKLDFSRAELLSYYLPKALISRLPSTFLHLDKLVPCFAWNFVQQDGGGSIASIGSTQLILSEGFDQGGCFNPPYYFFESYNQSERLGQMVTAMLNRNIQDIPTDPLASYTIMEHILLGDPSLKLDKFR
jgi:hypothetical protein